jgi:hypothetical protein
MEIGPTVMVARQGRALYGVLALGLGIWCFSGQAIAEACTSEECACEEALNRNTAEALEDFMKKYPQGESNGRTACAALAITPAEEPTTPDNSHKDDDTGQSDVSAPPED